ncbi:MAG: hypothetical protein LBD06_10415 [Candidatus Accumulibacter sp.]|nr:hypothetical protein [Accumulibacter sp.]
MEMRREFDRYYRQGMPGDAPEMERSGEGNGALAHGAGEADEEARREPGRDRHEERREASGTGEVDEEARRELGGYRHQARRETSGDAPGTGKVDEESRRDFDRYRHQARREASGDAPGTEETDAGKNPEMSLSSLIGSLFGERLGTAASAAAAPVDSAAPLPTEATVRHLVDQILVSHPDQAGDREVRLRVRDSVLPDTEIRLSRGADGCLSVTLATGRGDAFQTLVAAQMELKQALDSRENQEVRLVVLDTRESGRDGADGERRSRGHMAYVPDVDDPDDAR